MAPAPMAVFWSPSWAKSTTWPKANAFTVQVPGTATPQQKDNVWQSISTFVLLCLSGGPYAGFAGRDASRGLATFSVNAVSDEYDDLSDLKSSEMDQVRTCKPFEAAPFWQIFLQVKEWELQFSEKYDFVGKLIKPGEEPTFYSDASSDEEEEDKEKADRNLKKKTTWCFRSFFENPNTSPEPDSYGVNPWYLYFFYLWKPVG